MGNVFSKAAQPTLQPCRTDWVGEGASQMGKRLLTKGTASAVPKKIARLTASATEVRFSRHIGRSHLFPRLNLVNLRF
jgi:hypothetical protein